MRKRTARGLEDDDASNSIDVDCGIGDCNAMALPDYEAALRAPEFDADRILDRYFHSGQSIAFVGADPEAEPSFKRNLAHDLQITFDIILHPLQLVICGSAHLGFSPVPTDEKFGRPFNSKTSDIDVAVVWPELFDRWWTELQSTDLVNETRERVSRDLFWGFINPANVRNESEIGRTWWGVFGRIKTERAKSVSGRLYRNYLSMQNYHTRVITDGRRRLLGIKA